MAAINTINPFADYRIPSESTRLNYNFNFIELADERDNFTRPRLDYTLTVPSSITFTVQSIFTRAATSPQPPANKALIGPLVLSGNDFINDFSSHVRTGFNTSKAIYGTENPVVLAALGFTTGFGLISGGLNVHGGIQDAKAAGKISDVTGRVLGCLRVVRGAATTIGAALYIPMRALTIAALATASKIYASIAIPLGTVGGFCFTFVAVISGIAMGVRLYEQYQFRKKLNGFLNDSTLSEEARYARALEHLKQLASVSPQEKEGIRQVVTSDEKYRLLTPQQVEEKIAKKEAKLLQRKETYLKRLSDENCLNQIRQKGVTEAKGVIEAVQKKTREKIITDTVGMVLICIGITLTIASFFLGPVGIIVSAAFSLALSLSWVVKDAQALFSNYSSSDPGRHDKLIIFLSTVLAILSVSVVFFFSGGLAPIIAALVVGSVWLAINAACYYRIYQFEKRKLQN